MNLLCDHSFNVNATQPNLYCLGTDKWTKNRGFLSIQAVRE